MVSDFIFNGRSLSSFGYVLINTNTEDTQDVSEMELEYIKGARNDRSYSAGYKYDANLTATYTIIKNFCEFPDDQDMTDEEVSEMTRWLCRKQYKWFRFVDEDEDNNDEVWYKAQWTVKKKFIGDSVVGLDITVHTNAPYGFSKEIVHEYNTQSFTINVDSDEEGYIYPDITIELLEGGDLELTNAYEDRTTGLKKCVAGETITLLGYEVQQIESTATHDFITEFNYKFPRLCCEYMNAVNEFEVNLNSKITMKYREIRKVGLK